jgi:hypothetical protein
MAGSSHPDRIGRSIARNGGSDPGSTGSGSCRARSLPMMCGLTKIFNEDNSCSHCTPRPIELRSRGSRSRQARTIFPGEGSVESGFVEGSPQPLVGPGSLPLGDWGPDPSVGMRLWLPFHPRADPPLRLEVSSLTSRSCWPGEIVKLEDERATGAMPRIPGGDAP